VQRLSEWLRSAPITGAQACRMFTRNLSEQFEGRG